MNLSSEHSADGIVRHDISQNLPADASARARNNIGAALSPAINQAWLYGIDGDSSPTLLTLTPSGNWSSDGTDTAPFSGTWIFIERHESSDTDYSDADDDGNGIDPVTLTMVHYTAARYVAGVLDTPWSFTTETTAALSVFHIQDWSPTDGDEVAHPDDLRVIPLEPEIPRFGAVIAETDAGRLALGITHSLPCHYAGNDYLIPLMDP